MLVVVALATIMAVSAVIGYVSGTKATLLNSVVLVAGLALIARAGGTLAQLINSLYFGVRFVLAGGLQAAATSGANRTAAIDRVVNGMGSVQPLIQSDTVGPELVVVLLVLLLLSLWAGKSARLGLKGPASLVGLVLGLLNGYLLGAYLLTSLAPAAASFLPLPFGLNQSTGVTTSSLTPAGTDFYKQTISTIQAASENALAFIVMALIAVFLIVATFLSTKGSGRSKRNGTG